MSEAFSTCSLSDLVNPFLKTQAPLAGQVPPAMGTGSAGAALTSPQTSLDGTCTLTQASSEALRPQLAAHKYLLIYSLPQAGSKMSEKISQT